MQSGPSGSIRGRVKAATGDGADPEATDAAAALAYAALPPLGRARAARKLADDGGGWGPPPPGARAVALGLIPLLGGGGDRAVADAASRALRELTLAHSEFLDPMVDAGLLPAIASALTGDGGAVAPSLGSTGNLCHALCRLVKDSQVAVTAMGTADTVLAGAVGVALARAAAERPATAVGGERSAAEAAGNGGDDGGDDDDDDDPAEQVADLADELWQRMPVALPPVVAHWASATLPGLVLLAAREEGAYGSLRALVNMLSMERTRAVRTEGDGGDEEEEDGDEADGGAGGAAASERDAPPPAPPTFGGPLHDAALPGVAAAIVAHLTRGDPTGFGGAGVLQVASVFARRHARPGSRSGADALLAAGVCGVLPRWLGADTRPEVKSAAAQLLGSLLFAGPRAAAEALGGGDGALAAAVTSLLSAPYAPPADSDSGARAGWGGDDLWAWDGHMHVATGLAAALVGAAAAGAAPADHAAGATLARAALAAGVAEALLAALAGARAPSGGFGRCYRLLLRHALASLVALLQLAPDEARARLLGAGGVAAAAAAAARPEVAPPPPPPPQSQSPAAVAGADEVAAAASTASRGSGSGGIRADFGGAVVAAPPALAPATFNFNGGAESAIAAAAVAEPSPLSSAGDGAPSSLRGGLTSGSGGGGGHAKRKAARRDADSGDDETPADRAAAALARAVAPCGRMDHCGLFAGPDAPHGRATLAALAAALSRWLA